MTNELTQILFDKYGAMPTTEQTSEITGRSKASLELDRRNGENIPYKRLGNKPTSPVRYVLTDIIAWMSDTTKTV